MVGIVGALAVALLPVAIASVLGGPTGTMQNAPQPRRTAAPAKGIDGKPVTREVHEWSTIEWPVAADTDLPRVLLIGDSIACGYNGPVKELLKGKWNVDLLGTSRSINDPILAGQVLLMLEEHTYQVIHFNNGIHGWHLTSADYASGLRAFTKILSGHARGATLIWASTTPIAVRNDAAKLSPDNAGKVERNALAAAVMREFGIPTDDLYSAVVGQGDLWAPDGVHFTDRATECWARPPRKP